MIDQLAAAIIMLAPISPQCDDLMFARSNPGLCQIDSGPFPDMQTGGGGGHGGLLGSILSHIGLGGLL